MGSGDAERFLDALGATIGAGGSGEADVSGVSESASESGIVRGGGMALVVLSFA